MRGALLMGGKYVRQLVLILVKRIVDIDHLAAGIAEHDIDALIDQCAHQDI